MTFGVVICCVCDGERTTQSQTWPEPPGSRAGLSTCGAASTHCLPVDMRLCGHPYRSIQPVRHPHGHHPAQLSRPSLSNERRTSKQAQHTHRTTFALARSPPAFSLAISPCHSLSGAHACPLACPATPVRCPSSRNAVLRLRWRGWRHGVQAKTERPKAAASTRAPCCVRPSAMATVRACERERAGWARRCICSHWHRQSARIWAAPSAGCLLSMSSVCSARSQMGGASNSSVPTCETGKSR